MNEARERFGRIDVLMNNAGINPTDDGSVLETALEVWQRVQDVNLRGVFLCCKHGIPHLLERRRRLGDQRRLLRREMGAAVSQISYTASKGAVLSLSRELGVEFAAAAYASTRSARARSTRRCCRALCQGPRAGAKRPRPHPDGPLRRAGEIARAALFLASDDSATSPPRPSSSTAASRRLPDAGIAAGAVRPLAEEFAPDRGRLDRSSSLAGGWQACPARRSRPAAGTALVRVVVTSPAALVTPTQGSERASERPDARTARDASRLNQAQGRRQASRSGLGGGRTSAWSCAERRPRRRATRQNRQRAGNRAPRAVRSPARRAQSSRG